MTTQALARSETAGARMRVEEMTGRQKVAILCMAVGPEAATAVTGQLTPQEIEAISLEVARMEAVPGPVADAVLLEWLEMMRAAEMITAGGMDLAREILERAFGPNRAAQVLRRIQNQIEDSAGLNRLRNADPQQLGNMVRGEHPQTIALLLAHLDAAQTAAVLRHLDPEVGSEVIYRIARMDRVAPEYLQMIERTLSSETDLNLGEGMRASGGPKAVAEVMNMVPPTLEKELMERIARADPELSDEIRNLMFVFENIVSLDDRAVQRVLREVDTKELALALKASSDELKARIMAAMSQRAVTALKEEIDFLGPVRLRDVEAAQGNIVRQVRELEEAGEIVISAGGDDLVIE